MMPAWHHADSDSTVLPLPKSVITWFGGIFARLPPLAAGLSDSNNYRGISLCLSLSKAIDKLILS